MFLDFPGLRWFDLLEMSVMFYWVDLPMLGFPFEENSFEMIEYSIFPFSFVRSLYLVVYCLAQSNMVLKLEGIQSLIWVWYFWW